MLLVSAVALGLGAVALRDRARRHAVALVDVAGLSVVALGLTLLVATVLGLLTPSVLGFTAYAPDPGGPAGWELVLLACGLGLVAYGAVDRERVPAFLGALALVLFALVASPDDHPSLVGWPLLLALAGGALLVAGLRPRPPAPPEPGVPAAPPTAPTAVVGAHAAEGGGPA
jgi:multisubunit Na+/H+ antiporter MnhB subunit